MPVSRAQSSRSNYTVVITIMTDAGNRNKHRVYLHNQSVSLARYLPLRSQFRVPTQKSTARGHFPRPRARLIFLFVFFFLFFYFLRRLVCGLGVIFVWQSPRDTCAQRYRYRIHILSIRTRDYCYWFVNARTSTRNVLLKEHVKIYRK